nr:LLM class flavin-dependent oxidoreductase [Peribacillus psychrosaccharolyticus]
MSITSLFPGRIEAGVGRSPGGNETFRSLLAEGKPNQLADYPDKLTDLITFLSNDGNVSAVPRTKDAPNLYSLGFGENSAKLAAKLGIGYVYGHFINPNSGKEAHQTYRAKFRQGYLSHSAIFVICGETDEQVEELAISQDVWLLHVEKSLDIRVPSIEEAKAKSWNDKEKEQMLENRKRMIIGGPKKVKSELLHLSERYQCNDWLNLTIFMISKKNNSRIGEL